MKKKRTVAARVFSCAVCGRRVEAFRSDALYCSGACRGFAHRVGLSPAGPFQRQPRARRFEAFPWCG